MNKVIGGINPEAVEKGLKLGAKEIWLPTQSAKRIREMDRIRLRHRISAGWEGSSGTCGCI